MRITDRDIRLLKWMNSFGFVVSRQVATWMDVSVTTAYIRLQKLVRYDYIKHKRIFHGRPGIYQVTRQGAHLSGSPYPPMKNLILGKYDHDLAVVDVSLVLQKKYGGYFETERDLRTEHWAGSVGQTGHLSDGLLVAQNKRIAIEVELHKKTQRRYDAIIKHYLKNFDVTEVWYFCGNPRIAHQMEAYQETLPYLKTLLLETFLKSCSDSSTQESCDVSDT